MERYETYKDSGVEWIGEIPADWTIAPLKTLASIVAGQSPSNDDVADEGSLPFLQGKAEFGTLHPFPVHYCDRPKKVADEGSILMSVRAPVGEINVADQAYGIGRGLCAIEPETIDSVFLRYALSVSDSALRSYATGSTFEAVTAGQIGNLPVAVPNSKLDSTIADHLDAKTAEIDALVANCEREVGLLQEYRKAVISEAVTKGLDPDAPMRDSGIEWIGEIPEGWLCANLSKVIKSIQTGPFGSQLHAEDYSDDGEICVVNPANLIGGRIVTASCSRISKILASSLSQHLMHVGEIVFGRRGEMGRCALVEEDGLFCGTGSIELELLDSVLPSFAVYYLQCDFVKSYLELRSVGTTLQNLNTGIIATIPFVLAPIEEQKAIVSYLDAKTAEIDSLSEAKQSMADKLREYRKSLISEAVTGKFKVPGA